MRTHAQGNGSGCGICTDLARLARYEAPGPALLVAGHNGPCTEWYRRSGVRRCRAHDCDAEIRQDAHEEQHARCVAVVEPALTACLEWLAAVACSDCGESKYKCLCDYGPRDKAIDLAAVALAALTGEVEP